MADDKSEMGKVPGKSPWRLIPKWNGTGEGGKLPPQKTPKECLTLTREDSLETRNMKKSSPWLSDGKHGNLNEWDTSVKDQNQKYVQQTLGLVAVVFGDP